jgi:hypothetical protein
MKLYTEEVLPKVLANIPLQKVSHFHGQICPDLVEETKGIRLHGNFVCQLCFRLLAYQPENIVWQ